MKINQINNFFESKSLSSHKTDSHNDFKKILSQKIGRTDAAAPVGNRLDIIEHGDNILNLLEDYAGKLSDPSKTLRDINPLIERIENEVKLIEAEAAQTAEAEPGLAKVVNDLAVTANVAVLKFKRGDYL